MQNKYFGDIHDFYKYYFLKEVTQSYSLGVHWCLVPDEDQRNDGNRPLGKDEEGKDKDLYNILNKHRSQSVKFIKPYFSPKTVYYERLHKYYANDLNYEEECIEKLKKQDIIFFDPDNGIEVESTTNAKRYKYVSFRILQRFWHLGKSSIIYQHDSRTKGQLDNKIRTLYDLIGKSANVIVVKKGNVSYICFIQSREHFITLDHLAQFRENEEYTVINWEGTGDIA